MRCQAGACGFPEPTLPLPPFAWKGALAMLGVSDIECLAAFRRVGIRHQPRPGDGLRCTVCKGVWHAPTRSEPVPGCAARRLAATLLILSTSRGPALPTSGSLESLGVFSDAAAA
jgi:hypothetical protein